MTTTMTSKGAFNKDINQLNLKLQFNRVAPTPNLIMQAIYYPKKGEEFKYDPNSIHELTVMGKKEKYITSHSHSFPFIIPLSWMKNI